MSSVVWTPQAKWSRDSRIPQPPSLWQTQVNRYSVCYGSHICRALTMQKKCLACASRTKFGCVFCMIESVSCPALPGPRLPSPIHPWRLLKRNPKRKRMQQKLEESRIYQPKLIHSQRFWKGSLERKRKEESQESKIYPIQDLPTQHSYQC